MKENGKRKEREISMMEQMGNSTQHYMFRYISLLLSP